MKIGANINNTTKKKKKWKINKKTKGKSITTELKHGIEKSKMKKKKNSKTKNKI